MLLYFIEFSYPLQRGILDLEGIIMETIKKEVHVFKYLQTHLIHACLSTQCSCANVAVIGVKCSAILLNFIKQNTVFALLQRTISSFDNRRVNNVFSMPKMHCKN